MKLPKRVGVNEKLTGNKPKSTKIDNQKSQENRNNPKRKINQEQDSQSEENDDDDEIYSVPDFTDNNYRYSLGEKFFWRRNLSNELLIMVTTNLAHPKYITSVEKSLVMLKFPRRNMAFDSLLQQKFIRCHLSGCLKDMNLSIKHYLRVKSKLMFQITLKYPDSEKWWELTKDMKLTQEELSFIRCLVKSSFGELALMSQYYEMCAVYNNTNRLNFFKMYEDKLFNLKLVQRETEDINFKDNSFLDLRSNFSVLSRGDDLENIGIAANTRSRLNSFSDSHSLKDRCMGLENFNLF